MPNTESSDRHFFNSFSLVLGILIAFAIVLFVFARMIGRVTQGQEVLLEPMHLKDADGGAPFVTQDAKVLDTGKRVFAENCATCHSSKQPPTEIASDAAKRPEWFRQAVMQADFLDGNFLSDDKRYPVTLIGTNFSRSAGSNPAQGHIWEDFSSVDYKHLPQVPEILNLYNPVKPKKPIKFQLPAGGPGYYRTPSLADAWALSLIHI